jgi:4-oxalomesaconate tautomerase
MILRGGSSKGAYFVTNDLPVDPDVRNQLLLRYLGSPDARQIDGIGGAHPLTSKVAIVGPSTHPDADVDYLFLQVAVDEAVVTDRQNCGNLLAGVAPFALERGLVPAPPTEARQHRLAIHMVNTGGLAWATVNVANGQPRYDGDTAISGVPGTAAPIRLDFADLAGGSTGALLPTGNTVDDLQGIACTLIDNGMPVVIMRADALGVTGYEQPAELEANGPLRATLEAIRLEAGKLMNLGDVAATTVPKLTLVAPPRDSGSLCTRTFIPHRCHDAIGVLGAVSVATGALLPNTPAHHVAVLGDTSPTTPIVLEHPTGRFDAVVDLATGDAGPVVASAGIVRTARKLMDGIVYA